MGGGGELWLRMVFFGFYEFHNLFKARHKSRTFDSELLSELIAKLSTKCCRYYGTLMTS